MFSSTNTFLTIVLSNSREEVWWIAEFYRQSVTKKWAVTWYLESNYSFNPSLLNPHQVPSPDGQ